MTPDEFSKFEDAIDAVLEKYFQGENNGAKDAALAVALGDRIGAKSTVTIDTAVDLCSMRIRDAANVQRELRNRIRQHMAATTGTKQ